MTAFVPVDIKGYKAEGFIGKYQKLVREEVIPYQYEVLHDRKEGAEKSHVTANFINAARALRGEDTADGFYGMVFQDSDAAKWLEAAAYSLANFPDEKLERQADELIEIIAAAQDKDGYLDTYFTVKDKDKRWTNLIEGHEMYCAGHMMEAAAAYAQVTGKTRLLDVMRRNMEHIYKRFVTDGTEGFPGHPEIELALLKMYDVTGDPHALELAQHFIDVRGTDPDIITRELANRDWCVWGKDPNVHKYMQADKPVRELSEATGHAVRAVYLYTAMAGLAARTGDRELKAACDRLWDNITTKRMYITGGIGSTVLGEAFTEDYDLPADTAYCETCASLGLMFFARAMAQNDVDSKYADVMERAFYNTALAGMQLDGKQFFYVNPLESLPGISGKAPTHRHTVTQRPRWYACACCPPNLARVIGDIAGYAFGENGDTAFIHLYAAGTIAFENGIQLKLATGYPYDTDVEIDVIKGGRIALRIPGWSRTYSLALNGSKAAARVEKGYAYLEVKSGDKVAFSADGEPHFVYPAVHIPSVSGMAAVTKGPLVYCFEGADNPDVLALTLDTSSPLTVGKSSLGTDTVECSAYRTADSRELYSFDRPAEERVKATAIPYFAWCNRGENFMRVWLPRRDR